MSTNPSRLPVLATYKVGKYEYHSTYWYDEKNERRRKNFGRTDQVSKRIAEARFADWVATEFRTKEYVRNPLGAVAAYSVRNLADDVKKWARETYRKAGKITGYVYEFETAMDALAAMYGARVADSLGAPEIAKLRDAMIHSKDNQGNPIILTRKTVNGRLRLVKEAYRWARERGYVSQATAADVAAISVLKKGRTAARDSRAIKPVSHTVLDATARCCTAVVRGMIETQRLTGMRPGEVCAMKAAHIDRRGPIWIYVVPEEVYKLSHMEKAGERKLPIGPRCQEVLRPFIEGRDEDAYLFSPRESAAERLRERRAQRKTPLYDSHKHKRTYGVSDRLRDHYDNDTYCRAVHYACKRAGVENWNPNQIRHTRATDIRASDGIEAASVALGHTNIRTTELYAEKNLQAAIEIARKAG
jgi:integrase